MTVGFFQGMTVAVREEKAEARRPSCFISPDDTQGVPTFIFWTVGTHTHTHTYEVKLSLRPTILFPFSYPLLADFILSFAWSQEERRSHERGGLPHYTPFASCLPDLVACHVVAAEAVAVAYIDSGRGGAGVGADMALLPHYPRHDTTVPIGGGTRKVKAAGGDEAKRVRKGTEIVEGGIEV